LGWSLLVKAQIPLDQVTLNTQVFTKERTHLVINTDLLLAGERLQYKVLNLTESGMISSLSKILYVSLVNDQDSIIFSHKLRLEDGTAHGSYFVPTTLQTGIYQLLSYTHFSLNNVEGAVTRKHIYIINPYLKNSARSQKARAKSAINISSADNDVQNPVNPSTNNVISLKTDQPIYQTRERIKVTMENSAEQLGFGNYVLSVRKLDPIQIPPMNPPLQRVDIPPNIIYHLPELRGEIISGKVVTIDSENPTAGKTVAFSIPGDHYIFKIAKTNEEGRFFISIDKPYESSNSIVQVIGSDRMLYKLTLDQKRLNTRKKDEATTLQLDPEIKEWLEERSIQLQIQNAYFNAQKSMVEQEKPGTSFHRNAGKEFILDEYTRFPTLKETFVEVISLARIRKKAGMDVFEVFDPQNPYKVGPFSDLDPLVLLDGTLTQGSAEVLNLSANAIKSIRPTAMVQKYSVAS
jgi:hypothetical protein